MLSHVMDKANCRAQAAVSNVNRQAGSHGTGNSAQGQALPTAFLGGETNSIVMGLCLNAFVLPNMNHLATRAFKIAGQTKMSKQA